MSLQKIRTHNFGFLIAVSFALVTKSALAVLIPNGGDESAYRTLGSQYQGKLLSLKVLVPGVGTGERNASAVLLNNNYALTAAHNIADLLPFNPSFEVATGDNFKSNRQDVVAVSDVKVHPSYVPGFPKTTIDLAILHLAAPLDGAAMTIGSVSVGDVLTSVGFGRFGTPASGLDAPQDGYSRGWYSPVHNFSAVDVSDTYYFETFFGSSSGVLLNGRGASGDSGGAAFDADGKLVGITVAGSPTFASTVGSTYYLDLSQPEILSWIQTNSIVPEPSAAAMTAVAFVAFVTRRRRLS